MRKIIFCLSILVTSSISWQGCEYQTLSGPVNCEENPVALQLISVGDANCVLKDGTIVVQAFGGGGNYRFRLGNNEAQSDSVFQGLAAGVYEISVADRNNCSAAIMATVKNNNGVNITVETTEAGCNSSAGSIAITASDGTAPYQFKIDGSAFGTTNTFSGITHGTHTIVVSDASGCEVSQMVKVRSGISYSASISGIIENNCNVTSCHNGTQFPDFRVFKNIHDNAAEIKSLTADRSMPQEGTLTQAQINMIACWVDDGAPAN